MFGFGLAIAIVGIIGSVGTLLRRRFITGFYVSLLISIILVDFAAAIFLLSNKQGVRFFKLLSAFT